MKPEAQNLAIAEASGWTMSMGLRPPDYLNDLNAMHEAEKALLDLRHVWDRYCDLLGGSLYHCAHATAARRAEAFLRTLNLWTE